MQALTSRDPKEQQALVETIVNTTAKTGHTMKASILMMPSCSPVPGLPGLIRFLPIWLLNFFKITDSSKKGDPSHPMSLS